MSQQFEVTCAAELDSLSVLRQFVSDCCTGLQVPHETEFALALAVDEACTNIIKHGYKDMVPGTIDLTFRIELDRILISLTDHGQPFEPHNAPQPDLEVALIDRPLGGLGLFLIYQVMDQVEYHSDSSGNTLTLMKLIRGV
jgi:anti-sigma regulatory factor (Ser/Thr protein kinase)